MHSKYLIKKSHYIQTGLHSGVLGSCSGRVTDQWAPLPAELKSALILSVTHCASTSPFAYQLLLAGRLFTTGFKTPGHLLCQSFHCWHSLNPYSSQTSHRIYCLTHLSTAGSTSTHKANKNPHYQETEDHPLIGKGLPLWLSW